jgi:hypothetical protein
MKVIVTGAILFQLNFDLLHPTQEHLVFSELLCLTPLHGRLLTTPSLASPIHEQAESVIIAN